MVGHELDGDEGVDLLCVTTELHDGVAHRREIDDGRDAGEVLHQHTLGAEGDLTGFVSRGLAVGAGVPGPIGQGADVIRRDFAAVFVAQEVLEKDLDRERQFGDGVLVETGGGEREVLERAPVDVEGAAGTEAVWMRGGDSHGSILRRCLSPSRRTATSGYDQGGAGRYATEGVPDATLRLPLHDL